MSLHAAFDVICDRVREKGADRSFNFIRFQGLLPIGEPIIIAQLRNKA